MATEVTVTIQGKSVQHALFISEADQSLSLPALREVIANQEIDVPSEYKFLTKSGNAVSPVSELTLTLSDVATRRSSKKPNCSTLEDTGEVKKEESETSTCDEKHGLKKETFFEIQIIPVSCLEGESSSTSRQRRGESEAGQNSTDHTQGQGMASACPWIMIKHCMTDHSKPVILLKIMLAILLTLITLLISLMLSLKLMMSLTSGLMNEAPIADLFQRFVPPAGDAEALTDLKVKFSQLEVTHKFEIQDLKSKLNELEDLYLRDMGFCYKMHLKDLKERIAAIATDASKCSNATVVNMSFTHTKIKGKRKSVAFTELAERLISRYSSKSVSVSRLIAKIQNTLEQFKCLTKHIERDSDKTEKFLNEDFEFPTLDIGSVQTQSHSPKELDTSEVPTGPSVVTTPVKNPPPPSVVTTPVKTRRDCLNCGAVKKVNFSLRKTLQKEKTKHHKLKSFTANVKRELGVKAQNQKLSRQKLRLSDQKKTIRNLQIKLRHLERKNMQFRDTNGQHVKSIKQLQCENTALKMELDALKGTLKEKSREINDLKRLSDFLDSELKATELGKSCLDLSTKTGKSYSADIRRMVYSQLVCDVPVKHCGHLISVFAQVMCGTILKDVPSPSTCAQMAYELGVITTIQVMDYLLRQNANICLSWDATTIEGSHVNEIHLTVNKTDCLVLDVRHLPGGKTSDYVTHIVSALIEAADVYGRYTERNEAEIFTALKTAITSTLTDRAAVNACVTRQLCNELDTQLIQLNCNIHPLDSITRYSKLNLRKIDEEHGITGCCYGSEGTAANLINAVSVLRFKDGTGDPVGFKNMLHHHDLPVGTFVRYVGNRIHVLFHLAGVLVHHWSKLKEFIQMQSTAAHFKEEVSELRHLQKTFEGSYNLAKDALTTVNNQLAAQVQELTVQLNDQKKLKDGVMSGEQERDSHKKKDKKGEKKQKEMLKGKD